MSDSLQRQPQTRTQRWLIAAVVAGVACIVAWKLAPREFFLAYLAAILLPWSVSVGSLMLMLTFALTGGRWGRAAWPWLAINARLMPLVALLFVPWIFGVDSIYPWANSDILTQFEHTENRQWFYHTPFFIGRTVFYFAVWTVLAWLCSGVLPPRLSGDSLDRPPSRVVGGQPIAGLGIIAMLLTITWAGIDWVMSFDPFFGSTLFGALLGMGGVLAALSAVVAAVCFWPPLHAASVDDKTIGDLSSLLLAFLMLWAYFSFAHLLIIWTGNLPLEARFYAVRTVGIWRWITPILAVGGFCVPFLLLLSYDLKRTPRQVGTLAICLLVVRLVELWWMVLPAAGEESEEAYAGLHWATLPTTIAVVAVYVTALVWSAQRAETRLQGGIVDVS